MATVAILFGAPSTEQFLGKETSFNAQALELVGDVKSEKAGVFAKVKTNDDITHIVKSGEISFLHKLYGNILIGLDGLPLTIEQLETDPATINPDVMIGCSKGKLYAA